VQVYCAIARAYRALVDLGETADAARQFDLADEVFELKVHVANLMLEAGKLRPYRPSRPPISEDREDLPF
jgi:hypothetical protein